MKFLPLFAAVDSVVTFNDSTWSNGQNLFGTEAGDGPSILTVTEHLVERFRASDLTLNNGQTVTS
jgi:hypothetical protein|tara:strand:- start:417 stop:611 length:195 start_codon:yes stop_codon:yes gene_type:complete